MKKLGYIFFAAIYNLCRIFCSVNKYKLVFWNGHNSGMNGNFLELYQHLRQNPEYRFVLLSKRDLFSGGSTGKGSKLLSLWIRLRGTAAFFFVLPFHMATAGRVFFNDNFLPLGYMATEKTETQFVQLWHGAGAFKRFGLSTEENEAVYQAVRRANQKITHLFITSDQVRPFYQEAFAIDPDRIFVTGIPATDLYFDEKRKQARRDAFWREYPSLCGKKLLLYAPTFRASEEENRHILEQFDVRRIHDLLGEEWVILVRMHPRFPMENVVESNFCVNMTAYPDISDLYLVVDLLVTDYSSAVVEYALLGKPVILYAYDLDRYDRGFYYPYEKMAPGAVAHDREELMRMLSDYPETEKRRQEFVGFQFGDLRGGASERILNILRTPEHP